MTKSKKNVTPDTDAAVQPAVVATDSDTRFADLAALFEALDTRVTVLESLLSKQSETVPATKRKSSSSASDKVAAEAIGGATVDPAFNPAGTAGLAPDVLARYSELQEKRQREASARSASRQTKTEPGRLEQLAREFEGTNVTSARMRLQDLQTKGLIADFRVLPPGAAMPTDANTKRLLLTTDAHGFIISADVG